MMGHRGVRVGITYPEIYEMQIKSVFEALVELTKKKKLKNKSPTNHDSTN